MLKILYKFYEKYQFRSENKKLITYSMDLHVETIEFFILHFSTFSNVKSLRGIPSSIFKYLELPISQNGIPTLSRLQLFIKLLSSEKTDRHILHPLHSLYLNILINVACPQILKIIDYLNLHYFSKLNNYQVIAIAHS